jgi:hypothetical protein
MFIREFLKQHEGFHFKDNIKYRINKGLLEFWCNDTKTWTIDDNFGEDEAYTDELIEIIKNKIL